jgi:hypothetical protein
MGPLTPAPALSVTVPLTELVALTWAATETHNNNIETMTSTALIRTALAVLKLISFLLRGELVGQTRVLRRNCHTR